MTARYQPGTHPAYVDAGVVVLSAADRVEEVAALGRSAEVTVLGAVHALSRGVLTDLPAFAIVIAEGDDLRVVLRGDYAVAVDDERWTGTGVATWTEHLAQGATGREVVVTTGGEPAMTLPVSAGVVLVDALAWTASDEAPPVTAATQAPAAGEPAPEVEPEPEAEPAPEPAPEPETAAEPEPLREPTPETAAEPEPAPAPDPQFDAQFGATVAGRRPAARVASRVDDQPRPDTEAPPEPEPLPGDHDGHTVAAGVVRRLKRQPPAAPLAAEPTATLTLSTGRVVPVDRPVLIGRAPRAAQTSGTSLPTLVMVDDPYVSSTHLEVAFQGGALVATDRSTNGTLLTRPGRTPERLVKDVPTVLTSGSVLALSDDLTLAVEVGDR